MDGVIQCLANLYCFIRISYNSNIKYHPNRLKMLFTTMYEELLATVTDDNLDPMRWNY